MSRSARPARYRDIAGRNVITSGLNLRPWYDPYHVFMTLSWPRLFASFAGFFVLFNLAFALAYSLDPGGISNLSPHGFWGRFFFSVETVATVGYGDMHPRTAYVHVVAATEIFFGLMSLALITGMMFARFSRPTARILFARHAVIRPFDGQLTLMLRTANARLNVIMETSAQVRLVRDERTAEGVHFRRIYDLPLRRTNQPVFAFGWNLLHVIDENSPLAGATPESLEAAHAFVLITMSGTDETTGQTIMARHIYPASALRWNHSFVDILSPGDDGIDRFDYGKFHDVEPLD